MQSRSSRALSDRGLDLPLPEPFNIDWALQAVRGSSFGTPYYFVGNDAVRRILRLAGDPALVDFTFSRADRRLRATLAAQPANSRRALTDLAGLATHLWGLSDDVGAGYETLAADPLLAPLIGRFAGLRLVRAASLYEALLCAIPGVGRWTAEVAFMYGLGRPDVLLAGDLALQVAVQRLLGRGDRPHERELRLLGERWAGWRSYATLYLLMTLKSGGGEWKQRQS